MTASWGGVGVLWGKNTAFIFVRDSRYTKELIDKGSYFSLTFFESSYKSALKYFGMVSGRTEDKIRNAKMNVGYFEEIPYITAGGHRHFSCILPVSASPRGYLALPDRISLHIDFCFHSQHIPVLFQYRIYIFFQELLHLQRRTPDIPCRVHAFLQFFQRQAEGRVFGNQF